MAFVDLKELECPICLSVFTDPVNLECGHSFCLECVGGMLNTQERSGGYSCPECRERFHKRPALHRNITLCNIMDQFLSTLPEEASGIFCTQCLHASVPAVTSCLLCEASLCDNHLNVHSKAPEHVLCDPTTAPEHRKCSVHQKILEYYCIEDATCVCVSCCVIGEHTGHKMEPLEEASEKKKKKLKGDLQKLTPQTKEFQKKIKRLQEDKRKAQEKADREKEKISAQFRDIWRQLEDLEKRVLSELHRQKERVCLSWDEKIQNLETEEQELSRKMCHIEELCDETDPLIVLQTPDTGDFSKPQNREGHGKKLSNGRDLDVAGILETLCKISNIITGVNLCFYLQEPEDILLNALTAGNGIHISDDGKTVSTLYHHYTKTPERFQHHSQVLSTQSFSSGQHYWDVDFGKSKGWRIGVCYSNIERVGWSESLFGCNSKSWCLFSSCGGHTSLPSSQSIPFHFSYKIPSDGVRIYLDYEAGQISFYALSDPIRYITTFTVKFTDPLCAALKVGYSGSLTIRGREH
ncbi:E3 ubiquitin-protein ligase TRIM21-like [Hyperolius riggenbachi]|uniref:E3 ubiquitin-protein ligase TRIM21-like n=1 Tax=Hyperolius riggenbachi TaxID=752182 RepID=UPI0035A37AE2